jgi:hypothetical protein
VSDAVILEFAEKSSQILDQPDSKLGRTPRVSARQYMTTGVSGAALIGVGVLLSAHPGAPTESTRAVQLASFGSLWAPPPLSPSTTTPRWSIDGGGGGLFGDSITPNSFTPNALVAEVGGGAGFNIFNPIGPGGWLIGDGAPSA